MQIIGYQLFVNTNTQITVAEEKGGIYHFYATFRLPVADRGRQFSCPYQTRPDVTIVHVLPTASGGAGEI